jgi:hypothetical protein
VSRKSPSPLSLPNQQAPGCSQSCCAVDRSGCVVDRSCCAVLYRSRCTVPSMSLCCCRCWPFLLIFLLASLVPGCSPIFLPILLLPSTFYFLSGQSCEAETELYRIAAADLGCGRCSLSLIGLLLLCCGWLYYFCWPIL